MSMVRLGLEVWVIVTMLTAVAGADNCTLDLHCGWNAVCTEGVCGCRPSYRWSSNQEDCLSSSCQDDHCLDCPQSDLCRRCTQFIESGSGQCLDECGTDYVYIVDGPQVGRVCSASSKSELMLYVPVVVGVTLGLLLTVLIVLIVYYKCSQKQKVSKSHGDVMTRMIRGTSEAPNGTVQLQRAIPAYNNNGFDDTDVNRHPGEESRFYHQMAVLRPHTETFMVMLEEARLRHGSLPPDDDRVHVYQNVIHQLCRVVTLLNADETQLTMPNDGPALMTWADMILANYLQVQSEDSRETLEYNTETISTFKPGLRLVQNGHVIGSHDEFSQAPYTYERCSGDGASNQPAEVHRDASRGHVYLQDEFTEPIEV